MGGNLSRFIASLSCTCKTFHNTPKGTKYEACLLDAALPQHILIRFSFKFFVKVPSANTAFKGDQLQIYTQRNSYSLV